MTVDTKGIGAALNTNLQVGTAIKTTQVLDAVTQEESARQRAEIARLRDSARPSSGGQTAQYQAMHLRGELQKAQEELSAKDALILEWMHSSATFKSLAKEYGKRLGLSDKERQDDFEAKVLDLGEDNPDYANTRLSKNVQKIVDEKKNIPQP